MLPKIRDAILVSQLRIALVALVLAGTIVGIISRGHYADKEFLTAILVEAHGMVLDIVVIGVFILWLNLHRDRRERLRRYQEEIDDYREWKSEEAAHRIAGSIRRLNQGGVQKVVLSRCYLRKADLRGSVLIGSPMHRVDLGESRLRGSDLRNTNLDTAFLGKSDLRSAKFDNANLIRARLIGANANGASFRNADFTRADLRHSSFRSADFQGCNFRDTGFVGVDMAGADLRNARNLDAEALVHANNLGYAKLDSDVEALVRQKRPELLDSYKSD